MPHKGLDGYLDSLFDPVLSYGDAVGIGKGGVCRQLGQQGGSGASHSQG